MFEGFDPGSMVTDVIGTPAWSELFAAGGEVPFSPIRSSAVSAVPGFDESFQCGVIEPDSRECCEG